MASTSVQDGSLYAPDSPPYYDEYPFSMPPDAYLAQRPPDEELVVSNVDFGYNSSRSGAYELAHAATCCSSACDQPISGGKIVPTLPAQNHLNEKNA